MNMILAVISPVLAAVNGEDLVRQLLFLLVLGICVLLIWWVGKYFIGKMGAPAHAMTVWNAIFILLGLFVAINFLLGLLGKPLVKW